MRRPARILVGAAALIFALALGVSPATAAGARERAAPEQPLAVIDTGLRVWRVPYEYLSIRPPPEGMRPVNHSRRFSFAFWMPDGRPPAVPGHALGSLRPTKSGHAPPGPEEFVVIATNVRPWSDPENVTVQPGQQLANSLLFQGTGRYEYRERWGMIEITPKPGLAIRYFATRQYQNPTIEISALLTCERDNPRKTPCTGTVSLPRLEVTFHIRIVPDRVDRTLDAIEIAARMLEAWSGEDLSKK